MGMHHSEHREGSLHKYSRRVSNPPIEFSEKYARVGFISCRKDLLYKGERGEASTHPIFNVIPRERSD
jgi:hypothetical protein